MNIEDLSKSQLLLLTVLVNFVTAIATAVLTVSLLDEAPPTVTQTVNRIVERTIETIAPGPQATTETVVINNEEFRTEAIAASAARTVALSREISGEALGSGLYLPDSRAIAAHLDVAPKTLAVTFPDGSTGEANLVGNDGALAVYRFVEGTSLPSAPAASLVAQADVRQGQTVIGLAADGSAVVGIVSKVGPEGVFTSLPSMPRGSAAVNLDGNIIGIATATAGLYADAGRVSALLSTP